MERIAELQAPLEQAQRRYWARALILLVASSLAAALLVFAMASLLTERSIPLEPWQSALVAGAVTVAGGLAWARGRAPSLLALARRADRVFELGERLSTSLALPPSRSALQATLQAALLQDATHHAARLDRRRLVPVLTRWVAAAACSLAVAVGAAWLTHGRLPGSSASSLEAPATSVNQDERAANLATIAEVLKGDAETRDNSYLRAVAEAVADLAKKPDAAQQKDIVGLLDYAKLAYGDGVPSWLRGTAAVDDKYGLSRDSALQTLAQQALASKPVALPMGGGGEELVPELFSEHDPRREAAAVPLRPGDLRVNGDAADLKFGLSDVGRDDAGDRVAGDGQQAAAGGVAPSLGDSSSSDAAVDAASAKLAGGASQSEAGASRVAGGGTQDLDDANRVAAAPIDIGQQVLLPPDQYHAGKRIRIQITPSSSGHDGADQDGQAAIALGTADPTPVARDTPSVRDQAVFARVFTHPESDRAR